MFIHDALAAINEFLERNDDPENDGLRDRYRKAVADLRQACADLGGPNA